MNGFSNSGTGNSMDLGGGNSYGTQARDGSRPASAAWGLFAGDPVWRI